MPVYTSKSNVTILPSPTLNIIRFLRTCLPAASVYSSVSRAWCCWPNASDYSSMPLDTSIRRTGRRTAASGLLGFFFRDRSFVSVSGAGAGSRDRKGALAITKVSILLNYTCPVLWIVSITCYRKDGQARTKYLRWGCKFFKQKRPEGAMFVSWLF